MVKVRFMGTPEDIKFMMKLLAKNEALEIESISDIYDNAGTKTYKRAYANVIPKNKN